MGKIIYFDYCAFIILIILLISTIFRKMTKGKVNYYFLAMLGMSILTVVADIWAIHLDEMGPGNIVAKYIAHTLYLLVHSFTPLLYILYLAAQTDTWHRLNQSRFQKLLLSIPIILVISSLIVNPFRHIIFYLDENDYYTRGSHFLLLYVSVLIYSIYGIIYIIRYRKLFNKRRFSALLSIFPLMIAAVMVQFIYPRMVVEMFAITCGLLYISMMVQRPEEVIDTDTGLGKLSAYVTDMKRAFANGKPMKVILINVSNYSTLRDMLGYDSMNEVLCIIADKLAELNRKHGVEAELYYLGVGKFRFVISYQHFDQTEDTAQLINALMKHGLRFNRMELNLVSRICIADCPGDIGDIDSLLAFGSDLNAKSYTGEVLYASDLYKKEYYDIRKDMDRIIEQALADHKLSVYYQPIYSVKEKRFQSAEALLRLKDEKYGFISPEIFIPAAEKSGAIHRIGAFVLEEVCKFIASEEYKALQLDYIEVNLSVAQCMRNDLAAQVLEILDKYQVRPDRINLEITETAVSYSQKTLVENLNALYNAGISLSLDDFGTGYSNMRRIASLPFHIVKLDKSFVNEEDSHRMRIVLKNTIKMIKAMNMKVVVEGIETEELVKRFTDLQCEYIQGYYYSKPIPKEEFAAFLKKNNRESVECN